MNTWTYDIATWYPAEAVPYIGNGWIGGSVPLNGHGGADNRLAASLAANYMGKEERFAGVPHWLNAGVRFNGKPVAPSFFHFHKVLDMRAGTFLTEYTDTTGALRVACETFCHRGDAPLAAYRLTVTALKPGALEITPRLDTSACPGASVHTRDTDADSAHVLLDFADASRFIAQELTLAACTPAVAAKPWGEGGAVGVKITRGLATGESVTADIVIATCRGSDPLPAARAAAARAAGAGYDALKEAHAVAMREIWDGFDIAAEDPFLERRLRGAMFFLTSCFRNDVEWGGTPSGLSSRINWGNSVFWDSEFYMFPPLLLTHPQFARNMMRYRYGLLAGARANAAASGAQGARFGWQSHLRGAGHAGAFENEIHVTADIAYCAWWYAHSSGDTDFMNQCGRELITEAARFFASRTTWDEKAGRAGIRGVIPPDEHVWDHYAGLVDNSAMTNAYAAWVLANAEGDASESAHWRKLARNMWLPRDDKLGIFAEYEGYNGHPVKQADVGHLFFPLLVSGDAAEIKRNIRYYAERERETGLYLMHSPFVYGAALSRADDAAGVRHFLELSERNAVGPFEIPRESNYGGGMCITASGSLLGLALYGLLGIENQGAGLTAHPCLTTETGRLSVSGITFKGRRYSVAAEPGAPAVIRALD